MTEVFDELMEMGDDDIITLYNDETNEEEDFYHVATIDYKEKWYIFLHPVEPNEEIGEDEVIIYQLDADEEGNDLFTPLESEELLNEVYQEYVKEVEKLQD